MLDCLHLICPSSSLGESIPPLTAQALRTLPPPRRVPSEDILRSPIWTTWARYHTKVDQDKVLQFAKEIVDRGLPKSVMEIDDRWQRKYGDLEFDRIKFPDARGMVDKMHALGFKAGLGTRFPCPGCWKIATITSRCLLPTLR